MRWNPTCPPPKRVYAVTVMLLLVGPKLPDQI